MAPQSEDFDHSIRPFHYPLQGLVSQYQKLRVGLDSYDLRIHPESRIGQFSRCIEKAAELVAQGNEKMAIQEGLFHQAATELSQLLFITRELPGFLEPIEVKRHLQKLVDGTALPQAEIKSASSRDLQFELYMASILNRGGLNVALAEPDILVGVGRDTTGIAAKRPKSTKNFSKCIADASKQILRSGYEGIIAIDLSVIFNPENGPLNVEKPEDAVRMVVQGMQSWISHNHSALTGIIRNDQVFGILTFWCTQTLNESTDELGFVEQIVGTNFCETHDPRFSLLHDITRTAHLVLNNP